MAGPKVPADVYGPEANSSCKRSGLGGVFDHCRFFLLFIIEDYQQKKNVTFLLTKKIAGYPT